MQRDNLFDIIELILFADPVIRICQADGKEKEKGDGITSFHDNATGDCMNAIDSTRTRNGLRRAIESFRDRGCRKNSHRRNLFR